MNDDTKDYPQSELGHIPKFLGAPVPADLFELRFIPKLIDQVPLYIKKIREVDAAIRTSCTLEPHYDLIFRSFFLELENRPYNLLHSYIQERSIINISWERSRIKMREIVSNRNLSCEICGENRTVDKCHIIPRKIGGTLDWDNIVILCPTHHRLLDRFMLSRPEYAAIDWSIKSPASQEYAATTILENHKKFWDKISKEIYSPIFLYDTIEWPIYRYTLDRIMEIFNQKPVIRRRNIYTVLDKNIHQIARSILAQMLDDDIIQRDQNKNYLVLTDTKFQPTDEFAKRCKKY